MGVYRLIEKGAKGIGNAAKNLYGAVTLRGSSYGSSESKSKEITDIATATHEVRELQEHLYGLNLPRSAEANLNNAYERALHDFKRHRLSSKGFENRLDKVTKDAEKLVKRNKKQKGRFEKLEKIAGEVEDHDNHEDDSIRQQRRLFEMIQGGRYDQGRTHYRVAGAVLFLILASSLFTSGTITGSSVYHVADSNLRNAFFLFGSFLAVAVSYLLIKLD